MNEATERVSDTADTEPPPRMTVEDALRDAILFAELELRQAIGRALPDDPDLDQGVQWCQGHIATWRSALGDPAHEIAQDYGRAVEEVSADRSVATANG